MEGVNSDFKTFFTKRKRLSMKCAIEIIGECIVYYSENAEPFALKPKIFRRITDKASNMTKAQFKKSDKYSVYTSRESHKDYNLNWKSEANCDCFGFLKKAICSHVIAYSHLFEMGWFGPKVLKAVDDASII